MTKNLKKIVSFALDNYFISIFSAIVLFVGFVSVFKLFFTKPTYVYARVKVGQGLWWASTQRPSIWFVQAIKKGDVQTDLIGKPIVEIMEVRYYPYYGSGQYDIYLTVKLKVSRNKKTGEYSFNRSTIGVGSPIDFEFPKTQFSGTITELSDQPLHAQYVTKTVTLTKQYAYAWEYDQIKIGDSYFDGKDTVFIVLDKTVSDTNQYLPVETSGNYPYSVTNPSQTLTRKYITIKTKIELKKVDDQLVFGEEQIVTPGKNISIATSSFTYQDYQIASIE